VAALGIWLGGLLLGFNPVSAATGSRRCGEVYRARAISELLLAAGLARRCSADRLPVVAVWAFPWPLSLKGEGNVHSNARFGTESDL